jgi:hypothetical protein
LLAARRALATGIFNLSASLHEFFPAHVWVIHTFCAD